MITSQTRLRTSPIAALVNRVVPLTFTPLLRVAEIEKSIRFYELLGFTTVDTDRLYRNLASAT